MALPWRADFTTATKSAKEGPGRKEYFFMWWTAQRPDSVFLSASAKRARWVREFNKQAKDPASPDALDNFERFKTNAEELAETEVHLREKRRPL